MFALPVIVLLLFFIYIRPQEYFTAMTVVPWLQMVFGLAFLAYAIDIRVGGVRPKQTPQLPWMIAFVLWAIVATGIRAPDVVMGLIVPIGLIVATGYLMSHTLQSLKALNVIAVTIAIYGTFLSGVAIHQGHQPKQCLQLDFSALHKVGKPDGRYCDTARDCTPLEPGARYACERAGLMGTSTIAGRVRYRGMLQDPNELSLVLSIGFPLLIGLMRQKPTVLRKLVVAFTGMHTFYTVMLSQSRGGQLVFVAVLGMHFLYRYGLRTSVVAGIPAIPLGLAAVLLKSKRADADASAIERIECQWNALRMLSMHPITGVGFGQITEHWKLTAHNAYLLAPAELGLVGTWLWYVQGYMAIKILLLARKATKNKPEARNASIWVEALLAAQVPLHIGIAFLSFCYHYMYWIFIGLVGALYKTIQTHDPSFDVKFTRRDGVLHTVISALWLGFWKVFVEYKYARI